jgi:hypothetical protein
MDQAEPCQAKASLLEECEETERAYSAVVSNERRQMWSGTIPEYRHAHSQSEWLRREVETARLTYERHVSEHGC